MLTGNNSILRNASTSAEETRAATVEERKNMWKSENKINEYRNDITNKSLGKLLDELEEERLITNKERKEIEEKGKIRIGSRTIRFINVYLKDVVEVGDCVNYIPDEQNTNYIVSSQYVRYSDYQLNQEQFKWFVLYVYEDGRVCLVSDNPSKDKFKITYSFYKPGVQPPGGDNYMGFNNGVYVLNDICKNLYSKSGIGKARSINLEDFFVYAGENVNEKVKKACEDGNNHGFIPERITNLGYIDSGDITSLNSKIGRDSFFWYKNFIIATRMNASTSYRNAWGLMSYANTCISSYILTHKMTNSRCCCIYSIANFI